MSESLLTKYYLPIKCVKCSPCGIEEVNADAN